MALTIPKCSECFDSCTYVPQSKQVCVLIVEQAFLLWLRVDQHQCVQEVLHCNVHVQSGGPKVHTRRIG